MSNATFVNDIKGAVIKSTAALVGLKLFLTGASALSPQIARLFPSENTVQFLKLCHALDSWSNVGLLAIFTDQDLERVNTASVIVDTAAFHDYMTAGSTAVSTLTGMIPLIQWFAPEQTSFLNGKGINALHSINVAIHLITFANSNTYMARDDDEIRFKTMAVIGILAVSEDILFALSQKVMNSAGKDSFLDLLPTLAITGSCAVVTSGIASIAGMSNVHGWATVALPVAVIGMQSTVSYVSNACGIGPEVDVTTTSTVLSMIAAGAAGYAMYNAVNNVLPLNNAASATMTTAALKAQVVITAAASAYALAFIATYEIETAIGAVYNTVTTAAYDVVSAPITYIQYLCGYGDETSDSVPMSQDI